jgi:hypothetical protein
MAIRLPVRARKAARVLALTVPILAVFAVVIAAMALVLAWGHGDSATETQNTLLATLCTLIAGLFFVVFHTKRETASVPFRNRRTFLTASRHVLEELGYEVSQTSSKQLVSRPSFRSLLFGGQVQLSVAGKEALITGPKVFVEILRTRLRLVSHITNVEQSFRDIRVRQGERLLKRIHVSMRLTPEQLAEVGHEIVEQLTGEGAQVFCVLHLMAQSEHGIRESLLDGEVREWVKQRDIPAEIHKDHARWDEPLARTLGNLEDTDIHAVWTEAKT